MMRTRLIVSMLWAAVGGCALFVGVYTVYVLWFTKIVTPSTIGDVHLEETHYGLGGWFRASNCTPVGGGINFVNFGYHSVALRETACLTVAILLLDVLVLAFSFVKLIQSLVGRGASVGTHQTNAANQPLQPTGATVASSPGATSSGATPAAER